MFLEQKRFGKQILDFWAFLFFNLVFSPVKVGAVCHFLVQKLPLGLLYTWQKVGSWRLASFQGVSRRVNEFDPDLDKNCYKQTKFNFFLKETRKSYYINDHVKHVIVRNQV
jgi:hypothetical protein